MDGSRSSLTLTGENRSAFPGATGRGVKVAVIDSGVHVGHPHIQGLAGGVTIGETEHTHDYADRIGHGTAVMAAIQEKAPDAEYFAVRVFHSELRAGVGVLIRAMEWCLERDIDVLNLSLATVNPEHASLLAPLVASAAERGVVIVAADDIDGMPAFPGRLPGCFGVGMDWGCPREAYSYTRESGRVRFVASGYPRPIPGVPWNRNLSGISFAVANMTGFVLRAFQASETRGREPVQALLLAEADRIAASRQGNP